MQLYFITGNPNKFAEVKTILPDLEQLEMDLPEIQEIDAKIIIEEKLKEAKKHHAGQFIVEDQSFYMECLNGLPGPFIKWFLKSVGPKGLADMAEKMGNNKVTVASIFGYLDETGATHYFEGSIQGQVVQPRGKGGFGWDSIFLPDGETETYGEWKEKNPHQPNGMRLKAVHKLKQFLLEKHD